MIDFTCPACGYFKAIDDRLNGRKWRCPSCNAKIKHRGGTRFQIREKGNIPDEPGDDQPEASIDTARDPTAAPERLAGTLLGHYRLLRLLGSGSGGHVFLGEHETLKRKYAVKVLPPSFTQFPEKVARLANEAVALAKVDHPNVVHVHDFGTENNTPYLAMQYVDGSTLSQALRESGPFSNDRLLKLSRDLLSGLDAIHQAGLLHRDIKPSNIMLTSAGEALLADFGLAWDAPPTSTPPTGTFSGTAEYAAPELALGQAPDARSDLYALGGALYRATTGRAPFLGESATEKLKKQVYEPLTPARAWQPQISPQMDLLLTRLLSKERDERPATAREALQLLAVPPPSSAPSPDGATEGKPVEEARPEGPPLRPVLIASAIAVSAIVGIILYSTEPTPTTPPHAPSPVVLPAPKPPPPRDPTPKSDPFEKVDLERLQQAVATQPIPAAIQACADFLDRYPKSQHAESVLLKKMELHQELDRLAGKTPAQGKSLWTFRLKTGGKIQAPSYEELLDAYLVKIGGTSLRLSKEDVEEVVQDK